MTLAATVLVSEKFIISASCNNNRFQLFQLCFQKSDGSIFIHFPYQPDDSTFLCKVTLKANIAYPKDINFKNNGRVTKHKVKFSHHPDGRAHFSQDSKINTEIKNVAAPLTTHNGHIFTIHVGGINKFKQIPMNLENNNNKKTFYDIAVSEIRNLKFIAYWYNDTYLKKYMKEYNNEGGPRMIFTRKNNTGLSGVMLEDAYITGNDNYYLFLGCEFDQYLSNSVPSILFLGGFEDTFISMNHQHDTSFLSLVYPTNDDYIKLVNEIGTVDRESSLF